MRRKEQFRSFILLCASLTITAVGAEYAWPSGSYGLPEPVTGCPDKWKRGYTYHDTADEFPANKRSASYHFAGNFSQHGIQQRFCIKEDQNGGSDFWPDGKYCLYKKGICPQSLEEGYIKWDDEHSKVDQNDRKDGILPDGVYDKTQTLLKYCCSIKGNVNQPIALPNIKPFFLMTYVSPQCQKVAGMKVSSEFIKFDDNDKGNTNRHGGAFPYGPTEDKFNTKIYYCYYEPGEESTDDLGTGKELMNKEKPTKASSGFAVAIGCGVAGAIVGTASIAFATKRILAAKSSSGEFDGMDAPQPDAP